MTVQWNQPNNPPGTDRWILMTIKAQGCQCVRPGWYEKTGYLLGRRSELRAYTPWKVLAWTEMPMPFDNQQEQV